MAFIPFIPMVVAGAIQTIRGIAAHRKNKKEYDRYVQQQTILWKQQEQTRINRAKIIQRIIDQNPKLKEASSILGDDFWGRVMTPRPVPTEFFPDKPRGGITGDLLAGLAGGHGVLNEQNMAQGIQGAQRSNSFPDLREIMGGGSGTAQQDGGGAMPGVKPIEFGGDDGEINYGPPTRTTGGGYGSNSPAPSPTGSSSGQPVQGQYSPPPVMQGMTLRFDPVTGQVVNKFGGTVEF